LKEKKMDREKMKMEFPEGKSRMKADHYFIPL
jgi:hypothetical protein